LLCVINRVLDDHWIRSLWLSSMKGVHLLVDGRQGFGLGNNLLGFCVTRPGAEQSQRGRADIRPQPFPGLIAYRARSTSCTIELLRSGDKAMISLIAATTIQN
jgi:hypothetical protein